MNRLVAFLSACLLSLSVAGVALAQAGTFSGWQHGAAGHAQASAAAERSYQPLVVYFHTDWCPWCLKLNERYLGSGSVREILARMHKVEINPERGLSEESLFRRYGGSGFPSFFVLLPGSGERPVKLSPFRGSGEQSVNEFAETIKAAATSHYDRWALKLHRDGDDELARKVLEKSLAFNPRPAYSYYLQGTILHKTGHELRDVDLLRKARSAYERALQLDPGHQASRQGLDALPNF
jgi:tetratricopeptide (TPR) repeat protein